MDINDERFIYETLSHNQILQRDIHDKAYVRVNDTIVEYTTGGPYTILNYHSIYVGDIWVMAGQSNMRGHGYFNDRFEPHALPSTHIHLFGSEETWVVASDPTHRLALSPRRVHHTLPDPTVKSPGLLEFRGASLGPSFAAHYADLEGVPVGLVASAHGGTSLEDWRPVALTEETADTTLYGAMLDRIRLVGRVAGVLWYQGESDAEVTGYYERFQTWLDVFRKKVGVPLAFVQIGAHRVDRPEMVAGWMEVQDAQRRLFESHPNTAGVASLDGGLDDRLHLSRVALDKVGKRLALAAHLAKHGKGSSASPLPLRARLEHARVKNTPPSVLIEFKYLDAWKNNLEEEIFGFEIECSEKRVALLSAKIQQDCQSIRLYLSDDVTVLSVNYGMNQKAINLLTTNDMTLPAFKGLKVTR